MEAQSAKRMDERKPGIPGDRGEPRRLADRTGWQWECAVLFEQLSSGCRVLIVDGRRVPRGAWACRSP
jgi:hypothetical protein